MKLTVYYMCSWCQSKVAASDVRCPAWEELLTLVGAQGREDPHVQVRGGRLHLMKNVLGTPAPGRREGLLGAQGGGYSCIRQEG